MSSESVFTLKKDQSNKQLPSFCEGDKIISSWHGSSDFNFWFFSNLGYLLLRDTKKLKIDYLLFRILGGSENWLNISGTTENDIFEIKVFKQVLEIKKELAKLVIQTLILNNIRSERISHIPPKINLSNVSNEDLVYYYSKYLNESKLEKYHSGSKVTYRNACEASKDHDGLYTSFQGIDLHIGILPGDNKQIDKNDYEKMKNFSLGYLFTKFGKKSALSGKMKGFYCDGEINNSELYILEKELKTL